MKSQVILTPLFGTDSDTAALNGALGIGARSGAHVIGLFVRPDPLDLVSFIPYGVTVEKIVPVARKQINRQREAARAQFDQVCTSANIPMATALSGSATMSAEWQEFTGQRVETVLRKARLSDVVVFSGTEAHSVSDLHTTMLATLTGAGRPLLLAPKTPPQIVGERLGIAWNGSLESARALATTLPFIEAAQSVHLLTAETTQSSFDITQEIAEYLGWHGVACERHRVVVNSGSVGAALLRKATEIRADLFIMGGYGHSRLQEFILGGVTRHVLEHAALSVLMAH